MLRILTRCSTSFRFAPCLAPISQVFQPVLVLIRRFSFNLWSAQKIYKILMGQHTSMTDKIFDVSLFPAVCIWPLGSGSVSTKVSRTVPDFERNLLGSDSTRSTWEVALAHSSSGAGLLVARKFRLYFL